MKPECSVDGCDRPAKSRGWCHAHYMRWWASGETPTGPVASHRRNPEPCSVAGCERNAQVGELCAPHAKRRERTGKVGTGSIQRKAGNHKGKDRWVASSGYAWVRRPDHPDAYRNGTLQEHTVVMSDLLGRPLLPGENVHHKNGVRDDNRPENLELWISHQPKGHRASDLVAWAREILDRYGEVPPEVLG